MKKNSVRVAFFPCVYHEIDGVAKTSREFEAFAQRQEIPFFMVHAGPRREIKVAGPVTRLQLPRSPVKFPLDRAHDYDLLFLRHFRKLEPRLRDFRPDLVQITGPSDVGTLGAYVAWKMNIPLAASWQTNLHQYARRRTAAAMSFLPKAISGKIADAAEHWSFRATARFYKIPRLLFAPNPEMIRVLEAATGKPCYLMSHAVDTATFRPELRDRQKRPFQIGYVGRLTPEKNVRVLARLEQALLDRGLRKFHFVIVGEGAEAQWLRSHMRQAQFTGVLTGDNLSRTFANFDVLAFPSETDTFGLVVLEALASGVPAVVTDRGGPQYTVRHGSSGYVARNFEEFVSYTARLISEPDLLSAMRIAARAQAETTSWDRIFEGMYEAYETCLSSLPVSSHSILDAATT
ncbi:MAG TPA: glycosyltransferase [Candidatus Sulfotelmatobacter sp.]|nr:glycosyltransferase [Candidatus Sulfotelmatobacter sp.]